MGKIIQTPNSSKGIDNRTQQLLSAWTKQIQALLGAVYPALATFSLQHELLDEYEGVVSGVAGTLINACNLGHIYALWNTQLRGAIHRYGDELSEGKEKEKYLVMNYSDNKQVSNNYFPGINP